MDEVPQRAQMRSLFRTRTELHPVLHTHALTRSLLYPVPAVSEKKNVVGMLSWRVSGLVSGVHTCSAGDIYAWENEAGGG